MRFSWLVICLVPALVQSQDSALVAALTRSRSTMQLGAGGVLEGDGAKVLIDAGRAAPFFLMGEEHNER